MEDNDAQLQLKKRARRRLVGAVAFVSVAAVVLPMVMDQEPRQAVQDVEIRIPGQDEKPFAPRFAVAPTPPAAPDEAAKPAVEPAPTPAPAALPAAAPKPVPAEKAKPADKPPLKVEKPLEKPVAKPEKVAEKVPEKAADKAADKAAPAKNDDARRAAAILAGQLPEAKSAAKSGEFLVLIGAFANESNVRNLKKKLGEQGIKTFSEPLDTPQGRKTRLRAGPFPNREAAVKALEKMQRIGVSGVVAAKQ